MKQFNNEYSSLGQIEKETIDYRCYENKARRLRAEAFFKASDFSFVGKLYSSAKKIIAQLLLGQNVNGRKTTSQAACPANPATC